MNNAARTKLDDYINWSVIAFEHYQAARHSDALTNTRKAGEACCKFLLYLKTDNKLDERVRKSGYKELIDLLIEKQAAPRKVINWLETIQIYGNLATHDNRVDSIQSEYGYNALKLLSEWLFIDELKTNISPRLYSHVKPKQQEDKLKQQIETLKSELQITKKQSEKIKLELDGTQDILKAKPDSERDLKRELENALEKVKQLETANEKIQQLEEQLKTTLSEAQVIQVVKEQLEQKAASEVPVEPVVAELPVREIKFKRHFNKLMAAGGAIILLAFASAYLLKQGKNNSNNQDESIAANDSSIRVLVIPLAVMQDNPNISFKIEEAFINEIKAQSQEQHVNVTVIYNPTDKPVTLLKDAIELGKKAKCEIVYYGEVYEKASADTVNIDLKYIFIRPEEFNQQEMKGELETKYFTSLTDANFKKLKDEIKYGVIFIKVNKLQKEKNWNGILRVLDRKVMTSNKSVEYNAGAFRIQCYTELKQYDNLRMEAERNYQIYPDSAFAKMNLALIYGNEGIMEYQKAKTLIEEAIAINPDIPFYLVNYAGIIHRFFKKDTAISRKALIKCLKIKPDYSFAWLQLGFQFYFDYSKYPEALSYFERAYHLDTTNVETLKMLATMYSLNLIDNKKAIYYADRLLKLDSTSVRALYTKEYAYYNITDYTNSVYYGEKAIKGIQDEKDKKPYASLYAILGLAKLKSNNLREAKPLLQVAVRLDSTQLLALQALAVIYVDEKNYDLAYKLSMQHYRQDPNNNSTSFNLGAFFMIADNKKYYNPDRAIEMMKKAHEINPKDTECLAKLGIYCYNKEDYPSALKYFTEWNKIDPNNYNSNMWLGIVNLDTRQIIAARKFYQKCIELNPNICGAYADLGLAYANPPNADLQRAYMFAAKSIVINPKFAKGYFKMAQILKGANNCEEAIRHYEMALELDPSVKSILFEKAIAKDCK